MGEDLIPLLNVLWGFLAVLGKRLNLAQRAAAQRRTQSKRKCERLRKKVLEPGFISISETQKLCLPYPDQREASSKPKHRDLKMQLSSLPGGAKW